MKPNDRKRQTLAVGEACRELYIPTYARWDSCFTQSCLPGEVLAGTAITGGREAGEGGGGLYLMLQFHHQNDFCSKMGSKLKAILVSLTVRGEVTQQKSNFNLSLTVSGSHKT